MKPYRVAFQPILGLAALALAPEAASQSQSLSFSGGVLLNAQVNFRSLGAAAPSLVGPPTGGDVDRTYDDGFNRVDATGNDGETTVNWGYQSISQMRSDRLFMSSASAGGTVSIEDVSDSIAPSANLEYRGSLGSLGSSDWGVLLGVGYQWVEGDANGAFITDGRVLEDSFSLNGNTPESLPPPPFAGSPTADVLRIGSVPSRSMRMLPDGRLLNGSWELETDLFPVTGGLYLESQLAGRLNGIVSAGVLVVLVNSEMRFNESSKIGSAPAVVTRGGDGSNDVIFGGFVQVGLDWALWETGSLVLSARWQPSESFEHSASDREAEIDFSTAFALHVGFSLRF